MIARKLILGAQAVIFDFDGVLVDSERFQVDAWSSVLIELGNQHAPNPADLVGKLDEDIAARFATLGPARDLLAAKAEKLKAILPTHPPLVPGADRLVNFLAKRSQQLAIVSNSSESRIKDICENHKILDRFEVIVGARDRGRPKPEPDVYQIALDELGVVASSAIVLEDSVDGVHGARNAGIPVIAVARQLPPEAFGDLPICVVTDLTCLVSDDWRLAN